MKISEIFIGKASDGFLRRYAFVLFAFTYIVIMSNIWPDPADRPHYIALAGGWLTIFGFFALYFAIKTKSAYRLLTKQYPGQDFTGCSTSHIRLMGYAKKHSPESNVLGVSIDELKSFVKQLKKAKNSKKGFFSEMADSFNAGRNATGSYGSNNSSTGKTNSVAPLSGSSAPTRTADPISANQGDSTQSSASSSKSLFQAKSVHALSGAVITSYRDEDGYMTYKHKCEVCGALDSTTSRSHYNVTRGNVINTTSLCANCKNQFKVIIDGS